MNRTVLTGRLTKDVEIRKTQSGLSVASFTVAVDRRVKTDGEKTADFIECVAWRQGADFLGTYAKKGDMVGVDGHIQTRNYDDAQGVKHYVTEIQCDNVEILSSKRTAEQQKQEKQPEPEELSNGLDISSDDLPF